MNVHWRTKGVRYKQCCTSVRRRCNPALKRGLCALASIAFFLGLHWPLVLGAPQCPRKVPKQPGKKGEPGAVRGTFNAKGFLFPLCL